MSVPKKWFVSLAKETPMFISFNPSEGPHKGSPFPSGARSKNMHNLHKVHKHRSLDGE
jgi:hypothetical protein